MSKALSTAVVIGIALSAASGCARWTSSSTTFDAQNRPTFQAEMNRENQQVTNVTLTFGYGAEDLTIPNSQLQRTGDKFRTYTYQSAFPAPAGATVTALWDADFAGSTDTISNVAYAPGAEDLDIAFVVIEGVEGTEVQQMPTVGWTEEQDGETVNEISFFWPADQTVQANVIVRNAGQSPVPEGAVVRLLWPPQSGVAAQQEDFPNLAPGAQATVTFPPVVPQAGSGELVAQVEASQDNNPGNDFLNTSIFAQPQG